MCTHVCAITCVPCAQPRVQWAHPVHPGCVCPGLESPGVPGGQDVREDLGNQWVRGKVRGSSSEPWGAQSGGLL